MTGYLDTGHSLAISCAKNTDNSLTITCNYCTAKLCYDTHPSCQVGASSFKTRYHRPDDFFIDVSWAVQNKLDKMDNTGNHIYGKNVKLKLCTRAQSMALGTRTKFQLDILISTIFAIHKFRKNILEITRKLSETTPWSSAVQTISRNTIQKKAMPSPVTWSLWLVVLPGIALVKW